MIGSLLKFMGILLLLFVAYVAWVLYRARSTIGLEPSASAETLPDRIRVSVKYPEADAELQITQIFAPRDVATGLGMATPDGFRHEPYTLRDTEDPASEEAAKWVAESNDSEIRWSGSLALKPGIETTIDFPIQSEPREAFVLRFQYERKIGLGGQISFFTVPVGAAAAHALTGP